MMHILKSNAIFFLENFKFCFEIKRMFSTYIFMAIDIKGFSHVLSKTEKFILPENISCNISVTIILMEMIKQIQMDNYIF